MPECAKYTKPEEIYKNKPQKVTGYPKAVTLNDATEKFEKEIYGDLLLRILNIDLIVSELRN